MKLKTIKINIIVLVLFVLADISGYAMAQRLAVILNGKMQYRKTEI